MMGKTQKDRTSKRSIMWKNQFGFYSNEDPTPDMFSNILSKTPKTRRSMIEEVVT